MIDIIKTRFALSKAEFGVFKYMIKYGKVLFDLLKNLNK